MSSRKRFLAIDMLIVELSGVGESGGLNEAIEVYRDSGHRACYYFLIKWTNALLYSPLGIINCPTLIAFCGLLIFLEKPGSVYLELFAGLVTIYFGLFGIMRFGVYIDIVLIVSGAYLIIIRASKLDNELFYK